MTLYFQLFVSIVIIKNCYNQYVIYFYGYIINNKSLMFYKKI